MKAEIKDRDCIVISTEQSRLFLNLHEAETLANDLLDLVQYQRTEPTQDDIDAELGYDHWKGEKEQ